jgi:catechol 2,3-dioxygenase-like lactoylglutathione lyase family enzyme
MDILHVRLRAPASSVAALVDFYCGRLGLECLEHSNALLAIRIGATRLEFLPATGEPFYHFALLAPGNRFGRLLDWVSDQAELLPDPGTGEAVFDFADWNAQACYFHDPAGNIVEAIAYDGIGETSTEGLFAAGELLGFSEVGLVGNTTSMARALSRDIGLELWDGTADGEGQLAFVGEVARTLILCPVGRPWLPTGRPAEPHPVEVALSGSPEGEVLVEDAPYRISRRQRTTDVAAR